MATNFVRAYNRRGQVQRIPRHWLAADSPFRGDFTLTPSTRRDEGRSSEPDGTWTVRELRDHALQEGIDLQGITTKAGVLSAIHERASADSQEG